MFSLDPQKHNLFRKGFIEALYSNILKCILYFFRLYLLSLVVFPRCKLKYLNNFYVSKTTLKTTASLSVIFIEVMQVYLVQKDKFF